MIVFVCTFLSSTISHNIFLFDLHVPPLKNLYVGVVSTNFRKLDRYLPVDSFFGDTTFFTGRQIEYFFNEGLRHLYVYSFGYFIHVETFSNEDVSDELL